MQDLRTTPIRADVAAASLEGQVRANRFAAAKQMQCAAPSAALRAAPDPRSELQDQLIFGEVFDVFGRENGWAWGQARRDGYVGYVAEHVLAPEVLAPTHTVAALRTYGFPEADFKSPAEGLYSLGALVTVEARDGRFLRCARAGWMPVDHLREVGAALERDPVAVAERHLAAPYQWGGRESLGLDCSGLVQQALFACGRACPRDTDMQEVALGRRIGAGELARGDLVFWNGHVAWMLDRRRVLHATAHAMAVVVEPLADVVTRMRESGAGEPTSYRRL